MVAVTRFVETPNPAPPGEHRFLLIKAWRHGFWSDVSLVLGSLLLAEITGRIPVTHWGEKSLYTVDGHRDAFMAYFEPLSAITADDLASLGGSDVFPPKWTNQDLLGEVGARWSGHNPARLGELYLHRPERIAVVDYYLGVIDVVEWVPEGHGFYARPAEELYRRLVDKYLRPRSHITAAVDAFYRRHIAGTPVIAVHVRGLDKKFEEPNLYAINSRYFDILDREESSWRILLLTDDAYWAVAFRERYGDRVILTDSQRTTGDIGLHCSRAGPIDRSTLGYEVMRDTYLALRCEKFLGNGRSNLSAMVEVLKCWEPGTCMLLMPSVLYERNLSLTIPKRALEPNASAPGLEHPYPLGKEIDFSNPYDSRRYMREGWSLTESWGTWTDGGVAELAITPDAEPDQPLVLRANVRPFLTQVHDRLCVRVAVCNEEIAEWVFVLKESRKPNWRMATIPPRLSTDRGRALQISFTIDAPRSPASLDLSEDWRCLGLGFLKLSLSAGD